MSRMVNHAMRKIASDPSFIDKVKGYINDPELLNKLKEVALDPRTIGGAIGGLGGWGAAALKGGGAGAQALGFGLGASAGVGAGHLYKTYEKDIKSGLNTAGNKLKEWGGKAAELGEEAWKEIEAAAKRGEKWAIELWNKLQAKATSTKSAK